MYFSLNNTGDKVKPGARISLPPIAPPQNTEFDLIVRDIVRYFLLFPQGEVMVFIYMPQKLGCEPNNFLLQSMVNLAL